MLIIMFPEFLIYWMFIEEERKRQEKEEAEYYHCQ